MFPTLLTFPFEQLTLLATQTVIYMLSIQQGSLQGMALE